MKQSKANDRHVKIICLNEHPIAGDIQLCRYVANSLNSMNVGNELVFYNRNGALDAWNEIANLDIYYTARLHGAITAYMNEVPFFLWEYHRKCSDFLEHIKKIGSQRIERLILDQNDLKDISESLGKGQLQAGIQPHEYSQESKRGFLLAPFSH